MTGYTGTAVEKRMPFKDFALLCARAMSFCVMLRDEPFDATLPERFEPTDYYTKYIDRDYKALSEWRDMSAEQRAAWAQNFRSENLERYRITLQEKEQENVYLRSLRDSVIAWKIPYDLENMRKFMLEQIDMSINDVKYITQNAARMEQQTDEELISDHATELHRSLEYSRKHHQEELERTADRNRYLTMLRNSLW